MAKETELKLRCDTKNIPALSQLLDSIAKAQGSRQLNNAYFDTENTDLAKAKAALRIRENQGQYEQTLKTRGQSVAGMQQRGEWNWPISSNTLEMEWLQQEDVQQQLPSNLQLAELHNIFSTDFERQTWLYEHEKTIIEVAIDHGKVIAGQYSQPLCECELELVSGNEQLLWQLAKTLGEKVPLWLSDISKAERGYQLAQLSGSWKQWQAEQSSTDRMLQLQDALVHWQRTLEAVVWDGKTELIDQLHRIHDLIHSLATQLHSAELLNQILPWKALQTSEFNKNLRNNTALALSVQQAASVVYQLAKNGK